MFYTYGRVLEIFHSHSDSRRSSDPEDMLEFMRMVHHRAVICQYVGIDLPDNVVELWEKYQFESKLFFNEIKNTYPLFDRTFLYSGGKAGGGNEHKNLIYIIALKFFLSGIDFYTEFSTYNGRADVTTTDRKLIVECGNTPCTKVFSSFGKECQYLLLIPFQDSQKRIDGFLFQPTHLFSNYKNEKLDRLLRNVGHVFE